ncbi:MAG: hypothetical protein LBP53_07315 [Candidatus Peribacteria bacterium]|jgi:hypothetical protein|nr:hypothetical protein [Candidatus Peribacteria bacterium]
MFPIYNIEPNNIIVVADESLHRMVDSAVSGNKYKLKEMLENGLSLVPIVQQFVRDNYPQLHKQANLNP